MDAYRGIFVLCTINGPCAWHQAIAGPINKNLNAKLICNSVSAVFYAIIMSHVILLHIYVEESENAITTLWTAM